MDRAALRSALIEMLEHSTGEQYPDLTEDQNLREGLGLDSIDFVSLVIEVQSRFGIQLPSEELTPLKKVGELLDLIQSKLPVAPSGGTQAAPRSAVA
jgi:acyl carrier protein